MTRVEALGSIKVLSKRNITCRRRSVAEDQCWVEVLNWKETKVIANLYTLSDVTDYLSRR